MGMGIGEDRLLASSSMNDEDRRGTRLPGSPPRSSCEIDARISPGLVRMFRSSYEFEHRRRGRLLVMTRPSDVASLCRDDLSLGADLRTLVKLAAGEALPLLMGIAQ